MPNHTSHGRHHCYPAAADRQCTKKAITGTGCLAAWSHHMLPPRMRACLCVQNRSGMATPDHRGIVRPNRQSGQAVPRRQPSCYADVPAAWLGGPEVGRDGPAATASAARNDAPRALFPTRSSIAQIDPIGYESPDAYAPLAQAELLTLSVWTQSWPACLPSSQPRAGCCVAFLEPPCNPPRPANKLFIFLVFSWPRAGLTVSG